MAYRKMTVEYILDDREIEALEELLGKWQQYKGKDGSQPFEDWKLEDLFQAIMQYGCRRNRMKKVGNNGEDTDWYWCDSPNASNTTDFCYVSYYGGAGNYYASTALAVPLCFEI